MSAPEWKSKEAVRDIVVRMLRVLDEASKDVHTFGELIGPFQIPNVEIAYEDKEGTHIMVLLDDYDVISENRVDFEVLMEIYQTMSDTREFKVFEDILRTRFGDTYHDRSLQFLGKAIEGNVDRETLLSRAVDEITQVQ